MNESAAGKEQRSPLRAIALGALLFALGVMLGMAVENAPVRSRIATNGTLASLLLRVFTPHSVDLYIAILSTPFFIWAARRWPAVRPLSRRGVLIQLLLVAVVSGVAMLGLFLVMHFGARVPVTPWFFIAARVAPTVPIIAGVAVLAQAIELSAREQRQVIEAERLRARLADARLTTLTAQLRPHFIFNTLQNVSTLMYQNPAAADALLAHLGELLRASYRYADTRTIELGEELRLVRDYVEIARVRYGERVSIGFDVDKAAETKPVPPFLLQPIVENAIEHGLDDGIPAVRIDVNARVAGDALHVSVADSGRGLSEDPARSNGIGLRNTVERLTQTFGARASLSVNSARSGGTVVDVRIPLHALKEQPA
jgi:two-component system, LytTR family, sensor kinase